MSDSNDSTAVELRQSQELSPAQVFSTIAKLAADPATNVDTIERLIALQERMTAQQREAAFNEAMARLQPSLPRITKAGRIQIGAGSPAISYAKYEDIDEAIRPLLFENGFSFSFDTISNSQGGIVGVRAKLSHSGGHSITSQIPVSLETSKMITGTKAIGSATSYGKRYLVCMMLNLITIDEDDDGDQGKSLDKITDGQVAQIEDMISVLVDKDPNTRDKLLKYVGVERLCDIPQFGFGSAMNVLHAKRKQQEKEA